LEKLLCGKKYFKSIGYHTSRYSSRGGAERKYFFEKKVFFFFQKQVFTLWIPLIHSSKKIKDAEQDFRHRVFYEIYPMDH